MKKLLKAAAAAAVLCLTAILTTVCVSAEDVELSTENAKTTGGSWGQSVTYLKTDFDCSRITPDSIVQVEYELDGEWTSDTAPVEFVLQNYTTADPAIWAKVVPYEYDDTSASFRYEDMLAAYLDGGGSEDFSTVDAIHLGDCGIKMKATKFVITNCGEAVETTTVDTTAEVTTTTAAATEAVTTTAAETTAAAEETAAAGEKSESGGIPIIPIIIVTVVIAVIVVVVIIIIRSKRRFY